MNASERAYLIYCWKVAVSRGDTDAINDFAKQIKNSRNTPLTPDEPATTVVAVEQPAKSSQLPQATREEASV